MGLIHQLVKYLVVDLVPCLVIPVSLYLFFYLIPEIGFCFYFAIGIKLVKELFIQFSFFQQADLGDLYLEMFLFGGRIFFIQPKIAHDEIQFFFIKSFIQLYYDVIVNGLTDNIIPENSIEIFYE